MRCSRSLGRSDRLVPATGDDIGGASGLDRKARSTKGKAKRNSSVSEVSSTRRFVSFLFTSPSSKHNVFSIAGNIELFRDSGKVSVSDISLVPCDL